MSRLAAAVLVIACATACLYQGPPPEVATVTVPPTARVPTTTLKVTTEPTDEPSTAATSTISIATVSNPVVPPRPYVPSSQSSTGPDVPAITPADVEAFVNAHPLSGFRFGQDGAVTIDAMDCSGAASISQRRGWDQNGSHRLPADRLYCLAILRGRFGFARPPVNGGTTDLVCPTAYVLIDGRTGEILSEGLFGSAMQPACSPRAAPTGSLPATSTPTPSN